MCAVEIQDIILSSVGLLASALCTSLTTSLTVTTACMFKCTPKCPSTVVPLVMENWTEKPDLLTPSSLYLGAGRESKERATSSTKKKKSLHYWYSVRKFLCFVRDAGKKVFGDKLSMSWNCRESYKEFKVKNLWQVSPNKNTLLNVSHGDDSLGRYRVCLTATWCSTWMD